MQNALCSPVAPGLKHLALNDRSKVKKLLGIMTSNPDNGGMRSHRTGNKIILIAMKLTMILLTAACITASATGNSQGVSISMKNAPLDKVFAAIEKQGGYYFTYTKELLQGTKNVDINVSNGTIAQVMDICVKDQPVTYEIIDKAVIIKKRNAISLSTDNTRLTIESPPTDVRGRVVDENGKPVVVTVLVKGTNNGVTTTDNGEFELKGVAQNAILVISGVGIQTFELKINGRSDLGTINSKTKTVIGEEVTIQVQTGYQKISRERFVGSYSQLDSAAFHRRTGMGIIERLDGTVTGILFDKKGDNSFPIQIRGISTLRGGEIGTQTSSQPLVVVDNFPYSGDLNDINPNDVESVTVLKDAVAASIWGSRAGNGVIVVTTKRGRYNQPLQVTLTSNITVQEKSDLFAYPQMSISDFIDAEQFLFSKGFYDVTLNLPSRPAVSPVIEILAKLRNGSITQEQATTQINSYKQHDLRNDLNKYVYQKAITQQHYINLTGGTGNLNYAFSGGYNRSGSNIQGSKGNEQYTLSSNNSFRPLNSLEIRAGFNYTQSTAHGAQSFLPGQISPYQPLVDANGKPLAVSNTLRAAYIDTAGGGQLLDWQYRPLDEIRMADNSTTSRFIRLNIAANYKLTNWLAAEVNYQYLNQNSLSRNYYSPSTYYTRNLINSFTDLTQLDPNNRYPVPLDGILDMGNSQVSGYNVREQININKTFGIKHSLTAMIAGEQSETKSGSNGSRFYGYNNNTGTFRSTINYNTIYKQYVGSGYATIPNSSTVSEGAFNRFVSLLANASYTYNNRYTAYASARRDGSNVFGVETNNKWKPLWSAGLGWDISKESFYKVKWMPSLRLSTSYGYSGNVNNLLSGLPTIQYRGRADFTNLTYAQVGNAPNPNLRWEEVRTINVAADFGLLNNRLTGRIEYFKKNSEDLISAIPFPSSTGVSLFTVNAASLKGNGFEMNLSSLNIKGPFEWRTNFGLSHAKVVVTKLYNGSMYRASDFVNYGLNPSVGRIAFGISSYKWEGLDPLTGDPQGYFNKQVSKDYTSIFNDSIQNQIFHGSAIPLYQGFLGNSLSWENFTLSANITYRLNFYYRRPSLTPEYGLIINNWGNSEYTLRWQKPGDEKFTNVPSVYYPSVGGRSEFYAKSEVNILRGDNIRLQDVRLAYNWYTKSYKKMPIKSIQLFIYANNLNAIIWRKDKSDIDPDFLTTSSLTTKPPRMWTGGINVKF